MATLGSNVLTLSDWAKRLDPTGKIDRIVEMLSMTNPILEDIPFIQANGKTHHRTTMRTGLPTVAWRLLNQGVQPSKSTTAQADETIGMLEAWSETDEELAKLSGDVPGFRLSESAAFIESMNQEAAQTLFYGNSSTSPEEFLGLAPRYSSLSAANAQNIITGGGAGSDNTSIWVVGWGESTVHGIFPQGSTAGLEHQDLGIETVETTAGIAGNRMRAYRDLFRWKLGVAVRDWRYVVRIANIDVSNLVANSSAADLQALLTKAMWVYGGDGAGAGRKVIYMNRTVGRMLDYQTREDVSGGGGLTYENVNGQPQMNFRGVPIKITDAILETEAAVT
jgi:hypothetical protein